MRAEFLWSGVEAGGCCWGSLDPYRCHHCCYAPQVLLVVMMIVRRGRWVAGAAPRWPSEGRRAPAEGLWWQRRQWPGVLASPSWPPGRAGRGSGAASVASLFPVRASRPYPVRSVLHSSGGAGGRRRCELEGAPMALCTLGVTEPPPKEPCLPGLLAPPVACGGAASPPSYLTQ